MSASDRVNNVTLGMHPEYRVMFSVDIEASAGRGDPASMEAMAARHRALWEALGVIGIHWEDCHYLDLGDGFRLVLGRGVQKAPILASLVGDLAARLRLHNRTAGPRRDVRVRMAVHAGDVHIADGTVEGGSLEDLARLLDAAPLRDALARSPRTATVALAVSEHIWSEVVRHDHPGIDPDTYQHVRFTVKETTGSGWLHVPGHWPGLSPAEPDRDAPEPEVSPGQRITAGSVNIAQNNARVGEMIGTIGTRIDRVTGDFHIGGAPASLDDVHRQLADLRRALAEAQAAGNIDEDTYAAASTELSTADSALSSPGRGKFVLAMRRLKGLVDDVATLAAKVAAIIDTVRGS